MFRYAVVSGNDFLQFHKKENGEFRINIGNPTICKGTVEANWLREIADENGWENSYVVRMQKIVFHTEEVSEVTWNKKFESLDQLLDRISEEEGLKL